MAEGARRTLGKTLLTVAGLLLTAIALFYLGDTFAKGASEAGGFSNLFSFAPLPFAVSFVLLALHLAAAAWSWKLVCGVVGASITYREAFNVHFLAQVGKYIPGKVWGAVGKVGLSKKIGMSSLQTGHALVLESLFILSGCLIMAIPLVPLVAGELGIGPVISVLTVAAAATLIVLIAHPGAFSRLLRLAGRITGREIELDDIGFASVLRLLPVYLLVFLLQGVAFVFLARSFGLDLPMLPGAFLLPTAVGVGFLAVFSPGGLGVREVSLVWLIGVAVPLVEPAQASLVSIAARLWITLGEALAFAVAIGWWGGSSTLKVFRELRQRQP